MKKFLLGASSEALTQMSQNPHKIRFTAGEADLEKFLIQRCQSDVTYIEIKKTPECDCNVTIILTGRIP